MAMRETVKSLRAYLLVVGILAVLGALAGAKEAIDTAKGAVGVEIPLAVAGVNALVGVGFLFFGVTLPGQLAAGGRGLRLFLIASATLSLVLNALIVGLFATSSAIKSVPPGVWGALIVVPLVTVYLLANVRRLAGTAVGGSAT